MGPQSFDCGSPGCVKPLAAEDTASMGPQSFDCGRWRQSLGVIRSVNALQWGRSLSTAEVAYLAVSAQPPPGASMGPQSFDCGSRGLFRVGLGINDASMGPQSFDCGSHYPNA